MEKAQSAQDTRAHAKKTKFLAAYVQLGTITTAAKATGIGRRTHYNWLEDDDEYREAFLAAEQDVADSLEAEAIRRARDGVDKVIYHQGIPVGMERQYSDTLMMFLLKGHKPEKFAERKHVTGEVKQNLDAGQLVDQAKAKVLQFLPGGLSA